MFEAAAVAETEVEARLAVAALAIDAAELKTNFFPAPAIFLIGLARRCRANRCTTAATTAAGDAPCPAPAYCECLSFLACRSA